ncbi:hypothetical protein GCM10023185_13430 [Hymenobacter saemangeumensis]|uniref:XRE family transcriptional regulator n=1 Tax=Hymenobacter saemangeumensis TaxID=1084522 RepID=A0ABP8I7Q8_9BACT
MAPQTPLPLPLKYRFRSWLAEYPAATRTALREEFATYLRVTPRTVYAWLNLPADAPHDIPFLAVVYMAQRLGKDPLQAPTSSAPQQ